MVSTQQHITHNYLPSPGHGTAIQCQNDVKKKLMSQATHLPWYPKTHTTLTHGHFFFIIIILCAVSVEIQRSSVIGLTINHLTVSGMSLTEVMMFGRSDDKRPYLSSSFIKVRPFRNRQCHLSINARQHYNLTLET